MNGVSILYIYNFLFVDTDILFILDGYELKEDAVYLDRQ